MQHPGDVRRRLQTFCRDAVCCDDAPTQHWHPLEFRAGLAFVHEAGKAFRLGSRDIEEIERRRFVRQCREKLPTQIAVDCDHGHEKRKSETERKHDTRREAARPIQVGQGEPEHGRAWSRQASCRCDEQRGDQTEQNKYGDCRNDEDRGDASIVGKGDRKHRQRGSRKRGRHDVARARPAALVGDLVAKQCRNR